MEEWSIPAMLPWFIPPMEPCCMPWEPPAGICMAEWSMPPMSIGATWPGASTSGIGVPRSRPLGP